MLQKILVITAFFAGLAAFSPAQAQQQAPLWNCHITGNVSGGSIGFIVGFKAVSGPGWITCQSATSQVQIPVQLGFYGAGLAFDLSYVKSMEVHSANIGVAGTPEALIGRYSLGANIGATLISRGINADAAFVVSKPGASFALGLIGEEAYGLGVRALGRYFEVRAR
ncbi:MAG: hypothetical protein KF789_04070 [Bdellovibrionaceae bacterium]|nr:hypothetical protein [Pseudobdellovibrionaceae bacterium]